MNAKRLIVTLVFSAILIGFFIWIVGAFIDDAARKNRIWREQAQKVTDASEYINGKNYDVMYFGEDLNAPQSFKVRRIYSLSPDEFILAEDEGVKDGHIVIINDPNGNLPLEKEDWNYMLGRMKYYDYILIYLGSAELKDMQEAGLYFDVIPDTTKSVIFYNRGASKDFGFADDYTIIPEVVREDLKPEQLPVYAMIMKIQAQGYLESE
ncbi:MAG: hypothetical protein J5653_07495 [Clostridiales bacterium]|nr:hypothetical protein [Clostridiales bacterium]